MAQSRKTGSRSGSRSARKGPTITGQTAKKQASSSSKRNTKKSTIDPALKKEIAILLMAGITIILFLGVLDMAGSFGHKLHMFQFGLAGSLAYVLPLLIVGAAVYLMLKFDDYGYAAVLRVLAVFAAFIVLCGIFELINGKGAAAQLTLKDYYARGTEGFNGGLLGGMLFNLLQPALGMMGSYAVLVVLFLVLAILVTGRSLLKPLSAGGRRVVEDTRSGLNRMHEAQEIRNEQREARRQERMRLQEERAARRVSGVSIDSTGIKPQSDEVIPVSGGQTAQPAEEEIPSEAVQMSQAETVVSILRGEKKDQAEKDRKSAIRIHSMPAIPDEMPGETAAAGPAPTVDDMVKAAEGPIIGDAKGRRSTSGAIMPDDRPGPVIGDAPAGRYRDRVQQAAQKARDATAALQRTGQQPAVDNASQSSGREETPVRAAARDHRSLSELEALDAKWRAALDDQESISSGVYAPSEIIDSSTEDFTSDYAQPDQYPDDADLFEPPEDPRTMVQRAKSESIWGSDKDQDSNAGKTFGDGRKPGSTIEKAAADPVETIKTKPVPKKPYKMPPLNLLARPAGRMANNEAELRETAEKLRKTLEIFGVGVTVTDISCGPSVTRYELHPEQGVKVSKIVSLADDIKLSLAASDIRIEAPIPGKSAVGIEVPNSENQTVYLREMIDSDEFRKNSSKICFGVGRDIGGKVIVADIARMPHLLIAGATGSGKSVCINTLIMSILYKATPEEVRFIMIDPKMVELSCYNGIPHLLTPVVTDPKKAAAALNWAVAEMTDRYQRFADYTVRDIKSYNKKIEDTGDTEREKMPQIVVIVDELADLMMVASAEVEDAIIRLAQLARAAGIHLVLATQRPTANVITGLIKANVPSRIAFAVSSGTDSRVILDMVGAERLLGKGDMLFYPSGAPKPTRIQGAFVSDEEVAAVVEYAAKQSAGDTAGLKQLEQQMAMAGGSGKDAGSVGSEARDELFEQCGRFIIEKEKASIGNLQRAFRIGFNRAARIMDQLADAGVVGPEEGTKPRQILMTIQQFEEFISEG